MRWSPYYLAALPVMALSPLNFEASRFYTRECGYNPGNAIEIQRQGDREIEASRFYGVPVPNPKAPFYWWAGVLTLIAPPSLVAIHALSGVRLDEESEPIADDAGSIDLADSEAALPTAIAPIDPATALFGDDDPSQDLGDDDDPFADFDQRLGVIAPTPAPPAAPAPDINRWMSVIAAQSLAPSSPAPIAPPESVDHLSFDDNDDDDGNLPGASNVYEPWPASLPV